MQKWGLWRRPYIDDLLLPHNIDMMHSEKNVAEALWGTIMDIADKTKDNVKAKVDQETLCNRPKLEMRPPGSGKAWRKPKANFVLTRPQRRQVLEWFQTLMFPDELLGEVSPPRWLEGGRGGGGGVRQVRRCLH